MFMKFLLLVTCMLLLLSTFSAPVHTQSVIFAGTQATVPPSGAELPLRSCHGWSGRHFHL